jgi:dihydrolipoamide dehydrogenase
VVRTGVPVHGHEPSANSTTVRFGEGDQIEVDLVVVSVGRRPTTAGLGLESTGVELDERGFVRVDDRCRTTVPGVWAAGDVIATPQLAHVGYAEAMLVIRDILGEEPPPIAYDRIPWSIYCDPEVAFVGHSEASAREAGIDVVTSKHRFLPNGRAKIIGSTEGLVKVIAERRPDGTAGRIVGVHMVGPWVTEQLGQGYLAVNWEASVDDVASLIQPHPTLSEVFGDAVLALTGRRIYG